MRTTFGFVAGLALAMMAVVLGGMIWDTRKTHIIQVFPQAGIDAWSKASFLISVAAFVAAAALLFAFVSTIGFRKSWPIRSFIWGLAAGGFAGSLVDAWYFHLMNAA